MPAPRILVTVAQGHLDEELAARMPAVEDLGKQAMTRPSARERRPTSRLG